MQTLRRHRAIMVATGVFLLLSAVGMGLAFAGSDLLGDRRISVPLLLGLLVTGVFALLGWATERTRREEQGIEELERRLALEARIEEREDALRAERARVAESLAAAQVAAAAADETERDLRAQLEGRDRALEEMRAESDARVDRANEELLHERRLRAQAEQSHRDEKEWALHLRREVTRLQNEHGALGDTGDVRTLVLHTALALVGAEKGLLLSRADEDGDRLLDLACHEGFEHDPSESAVAQRFAREVLRRDETVREDDEPDIARERRTPADEEIRNLLAIPIYIADDFSGVVVLANKPGGFSDYSDEVLLALGDHAGAALQNAKLHHELRSSYVGTVRVLADAIAAKGRLQGHSEELPAYVAAVARQLDLDSRKRDELVYSSLLHDVGKIGISERILMKPGPLTPEERKDVELHPRIGYRLVQQVPALRGTELAVLHHHERWDGAGYPAGLRGEEIPLEARIVGVADAFGAMTSERPYRPRLTVEQACAELERNAGTQFDPTVVRLFAAEVRKRPPARDEPDALHEALDDPEIAPRRRDGAPLLGAATHALTDSLTLLYARRYLHELADSEARRAAAGGRPFAVVLVELAGLAEVNRRGGYAAGDSVIRDAARAVERVAAARGGTACRSSGSSLAILLPGGDEEASACAGELAATLSGDAGARVAHALWREGDSGDDVIARARTALAPGATPSARAPEHTRPTWDTLRSWPPPGER